MERLPTRLHGPILLAPPVHGDARGFFTESYRVDHWTAEGVDAAFVQDNHSRSGRGVVRGMHVTLGPGQAKLVRCARGKIWDVVVDVRTESPTYGEWEGFELDDESMHQLYVPLGFAHGFCVLSEIADVTYKVSSYYDPAHRARVRVRRSRRRHPVAVGHRAAGVRARPHRAAAVGAAARPAVLTGGAVERSWWRGPIQEASRHRSAATHHRSRVAPSSARAWPCASHARTAHRRRT